MLAERGLDISYETVRRWFLKFGSTIAANLRRARPRPSDHWHLDEMVIVIQRKRYWLWRAVDSRTLGWKATESCCRCGTVGIMLPLSEAKRPLETRGLSVRR